MIRGVHHVSLHARNLDRMLEFYRQAFGFRLVGNEMEFQNSKVFDDITGVQGGKARIAMLDAGNCFIELFEWQAPESRPSNPLSPNDHGYTHFCVDVTDIEAEYPRLVELGMTFTQPQPVVAGVFKTVYGCDPEGNVIEIQEVPDNDKFNLMHLRRFEDTGLSTPNKSLCDPAA